MQHPAPSEIKPYQSFDDSNEDLFVSAIYYDHPTPYMLVGSIADWEFVEYYSIPQAMADHVIRMNRMKQRREKE